MDKNALFTKIAKEEYEDGDPVHHYNRRSDKRVQVKHVSFYRKTSHSDTEHNVVRSWHDRGAGWRTAPPHGSFRTLVTSSSSKQEADPRARFLASLPRSRRQKLPGHRSHATPVDVWTAVLRRSSAGYAVC